MSDVSKRFLLSLLKRINYFFNDIYKIPWYSKFIFFAYYQLITKRFCLPPPNKNLALWISHHPCGSSAPAICNDKFLYFVRQPYEKTVGCKAATMSNSIFNIIHFLCNFCAISGGHKAAAGHARLHTVSKSNVWFLVSDTGFSGRISVFRRAGKIFSCQHLDLKLS